VYVYLSSLKLTIPISSKGKSFMNLSAENVNSVKWPVLQSSLSTIPPISVLWKMSKSCICSQPLC